MDHLQKLFESGVDRGRMAHSVTSIPKYQTLPDATAVFQIFVPVSLHNLRPATSVRIGLWGTFRPSYFSDLL